MANKVTILGVGNVGATLAYTLVSNALVDQLVLVNRNRARAEGEAADLSHAASFTRRKTIVKAGGVDDTRGSDVVVIAASVVIEGSAPDRNAFAEGNLEIARSWVPPLAMASPDAVFVVVSNPVDVMTYIVSKLSGLASRQVIGTGTLIDSGRWRSLLSDHLQIHPDDVRAYILGEHGETQFPALSVAATGGERLDQGPLHEELFEQAKQAGVEVYRRKGYTNFAIAQATSLMIETILTDARRTLPTSVLLDNYFGVSDVCLSVPVIIGRRGVLRQLRPHLNESEIAKLHASADHVRQVIKRVFHP
ncbi:MAG: hypothetical protein KDA83_19870 [Planctomycetales bacterium]|nr:hypothetical protein [Planctomycetales bacterium]